MPGYNHYSWCTCGWCVKYGSSRYEAADGQSQISLQTFFDKYSARRFLNEHGALRSTTACFVNPNARCPVCKEPVYYYQNAAGSRVFFDELGPPWPKHPCTDNSQSRASDGTYTAPTRRARGLTLELLEAARKLAEEDLSPGQPDDTSDTWILAEVIRVNRSGWRNDVLAEYVGSADRMRATFEFDSADEVLKPGDIFSIKGAVISVFDLTAMKPKRYNIRSIKIRTDDDADEI